MKTTDRINELFLLCGGPNGFVEMRSALKLLWPTLNNAVSLVDLAGVFAVSIPSSLNTEVLNGDLFSDFFRSFARLKFSAGSDFVEKLLEELGPVKRLMSDHAVLNSVADKNTVRILLKFDLPLRRAFSLFCSKSLRGGRVTWEEVRQLSLGVELDGFLSFCGAYSIVPTLFSTQQCEVMFREVSSRFPLQAANASLNSALLFPQFQLLVALMASERYAQQARKGERNFAKKVVTDGKASGTGGGKSLAESLADFLKDVGISKAEEAGGAGPEGRLVSSMPHPLGNSNGRGSSALMVGSVVPPSLSQPGSGASTKQSTLLRIEHLFDEIEAKLVAQLPADSSVLSLLSRSGEDGSDAKLKLSSKPVVINDAVPLPSSCPEIVEQLLEAALAHHNLGSFEEALKFLEAARIQLGEVRSQLEEEEEEEEQDKPQSVGSKTVGKNGKKDAFFDVEMYISLCKGNVYQSCSDDEQALLQYVEGWSKARQQRDKDWEVICVNCAGLLAFFNLRHDVALLCFHCVLAYREEAYGAESSDTAAALNNEACALFCLAKRGEARLRFEKAWHSLTACLGHRAPRSVTVWKNLEKARRSHAPLQSKADMKESVQLREDASKLLIGGTFVIQALPPPEASKKKKGGGKKKKKKT